MSLNPKTLPLPRAAHQRLARLLHAMQHILEPSTREPGDPAAGDALAAWLADQGQPAWRAKAIRRWLIARRASSFADMTDLPKGLRTALEGAFRIWTTPALP